MNTQQVWLRPQRLLKMQPVNILVGNGKKLMSSHPQLRSYGPPVFSNSGGRGSATLQRMGSKPVKSISSVASAYRL